MKTTLLTMAVALTGWSTALLAGCGDDGGTHYCDSWCEMALSVELEQLEDEGCELTDDEAELESDCFDICRETSLDTPDPSQIKDCVDCVRGEVGGSPSWQQFQNALNGACESICLAQSMLDFYEDFWDDWGYEDYDFECD